MKQKLPFVGGRDLSNLPKWGSETLNGIFGKWSIVFVYDEVGHGVACMCVNAIVDFGNKLHYHPYETVTLLDLWLKNLDLISKCFLTLQNFLNTE